MAKADLIAQAKELGIELEGNETVAELEALLAVPEEGEGNDGEPVGEVLTRRKISRGNTRRITRANEAFAKACGAFCKEMDVLVYMTDEETGERSGAWKGLLVVDDCRESVNDMVNEILNG